MTACSVVLSPPSARERGASGARAPGVGPPADFSLGSRRSSVAGLSSYRMASWEAKRKAFSRRLRVASALVTSTGASALRTRMNKGFREVANQKRRSVYCKQAPCHREALALVAIEQGRSGLAAKHRGELPRQVGCVSHARVHALPARGAVNVRGIARQECAALLEVVRGAMVQTVTRAPPEFRDAKRDGGEIVRERLDVARGERRVRRSVVGTFLRTRPDQAKQAALGKGERGEYALSGEKEVESVRREVSLEDRVGENEFLLVRCAVKTEPQLFSHDAVRAIAAHQKSRANLFDGRRAAVATLRGHRGMYAIVRDRHGIEPGAPLDLRAAARERIGEQLFGLGLRHEEDEREGRVIDADVPEFDLDVAPFLHVDQGAEGAAPLLDQRLREAVLVE